MAHFDNERSHQNFFIAYCDRLEPARNRRSGVISLNFLCYFAVSMIKAYQKITFERKHICRFYPSCSEFSKIAYTKYNFLYATICTIRRLIACGDPFLEWPKENYP